MIFVTVGSQLPFDRLILGMDAWAARNRREIVFAQTGNDKLKPRYIECVTALSADAFRQKIIEADIVVSHAGMGNVLLALELQKPIVLMPRRANLKEHRNDHQTATVNWLKEKYGFPIALTAEDLDDAISKARQSQTNSLCSLHASQELLDTIKDFIMQGAP